ncbi:thermonuclease family protein [Candidatus Pacearchaeota archaeon]|nr:thermonuclease family protein [Candidatus Pacearchaeota archaeon]
MAHDFDKFPELTNGQMNIYYFQSPHKQIVEDFRAKVIKVTDGDTIRVSAPIRDFDFPIRLADIAAPEMNEGGEESRDWLADRILGLEVMVEIDFNNRVGRYGRLIGTIISFGLNINEQSLMAGMSVPFGTHELIPDLSKTIARAAV